MTPADEAEAEAAMALLVLGTPVSWYHGGERDDVCYSWQAPDGTLYLVSRNPFLGDPSPYSIYWREESQAKWHTLYQDGKKRPREFANVNEGQTACLRHYVMGKWASEHCAEVPE